MQALCQETPVLFDRKSEKKASDASSFDILKSIIVNDDDSNNISASERKEKEREKKLDEESQNKPIDCNLLNGRINRADPTAHHGWKASEPMIASFQEQEMPNEMGNTVFLPLFFSYTVIYFSFVRWHLSLSFSRAPCVVLFCSSVRNICRPVDLVPLASFNSIVMLRYFHFSLSRQS